MNIVKYKLIGNSRFVFHVLAFGLVLIPLFFDSSLEFGVSSLPKETAGIITVGICLVLLSISSLQNGKITKFYFDAPLIWLGFVGLLIASLFSALWATNAGLTFLNAYLWITSFITFALIAFLRASADECLLILVALVLGTSLNSLFALYQYYFDAALSFQAASPAGSYGNRNFAAQLVATVLPISFLAVLFARKVLHYSCAIVCSLILGLHLFHTFTRACWVSVFFTLIILALLLSYNNQLRKGLAEAFSLRKLILCVFGIILFIVGANLSSQGFEWRFGEAISRASSIVITEDDFESLEDQKYITEANNVSIRNRFKKWANASVMFWESLPFGVGEGNFEVVFPKYSHAIYPTPFSGKENTLYFLHQDYLEMLIELGVFGIFFGGLLILGFLNLLFKCCKKDGLTFKVKLIVVSAGLGLLGICITGFFSGPFQWPVQRLYLFILSGSLVSLVSLFSGNKEKTVSFIPGNFLRLSMFAFGIFLIISGSIRYQFNSQSNKQYKLMLEGFSSGAELDLIYFHAEKALETWPDFVEARLLYSAILLKNRQYDQALEQLSLLCKHYPYNYRAIENMVTLFLETGKFELALEHLDLMQEIVPGDPVATANAAAIESARLNYRKAQNYLLCYANGFYSEPRSYILLAQNAMNDKRLADAEFFLKNGLEKFPNNDLLLRSFHLLKEHMNSF